MNLQEQALWNKNKAFFSPFGVADPLAFDAYFGKYALLKGETPDAEQQMLLGVLFKHAPDETFAKFFPVYYAQFRTSEQSMLFDAWLGDIAAERPDLLKRTFKSAAPHLNFTQQVMVLRDVQRWFPGSPIKEYATPKLLKTKPTVVLKQFTPALVDMPYLLDMSVSLMNTSDAQSQILGDTIVRGCFIARYGMPPENDEKPGVSVKYSSIAAFSMLQEHGIAMDPETLLQQVQLRYNAQSVMFDALAYCERVLSLPTLYPTMQGNANAVLANLLTFSENNLGHKGFDFFPIGALARIHALVDESTQTRIQTHLAQHMLFQDAQDLLTVLTMAARHNGPLVKTLACALLQSVPASERTAFLQMAIFDAEDENVPLGMLGLNHPPQEVAQALFEQIPSSEVASLVATVLRCIFEDEGTHDRDDRVGCTHKLQDVLRSMVELQWSEEQRTAFQQSPQATTVLLLYMYLAATGARRWPESVQSSGVPNIDWMPLPVLKMLYPEQMPVWNRMTIELLNMPLSSQPEESDEHMRYYTSVMAAMYNALAQTFLENAPSFLATQGLIESLGVGALEYFERAPHKKESMMQWDLPEGMFSFDAP